MSEDGSADGQRPSLEAHVESVREFLEPFDEAMRESFGWYVVAKKEYRDSIRSMGLWVLTFVFAALFIVPVAGALYLGISLGPGVTDKLGTKLLITLVYRDMATVLLPVIAMFVGFGAITKERESGSMKVLLSLPHSRKDVVVGKVIGRCAVVGVSLAVGLAATGLFLAVSGIGLKLQLFALFGVYTLGLSLVFVAIAVSISGAVSRSLYSLIGNFVVYLYFTFGWNSVANGVASVLRDQLNISGAARWHITMLVKLLNPTQSYKTLAQSDLGVSRYSLFTGRSIETITATQARYEMFNKVGVPQRRTICTDVLQGNATNLTRTAGNTTQVVDVSCQAAAGGGLPFYYSDPAVFVYILLWIGVAAFLSYRTFNLADL